MNKYVKIGILLIAVLAVIMVVRHLKVGSGTTQGSSDFVTESKSWNVDEKEPSHVNVYIDASASMRGYFSKASDARFITALANTEQKEYMWMSDAYKKIMGMPTMELLNSSFSGADSRFDMMLAKLCKRDSLNKSDGISLLFTDGIISCSAAESKKNPKFMTMSFGAFEAYIASSLKEYKGLAVAVFQLDAKYNGTYWNYENKPVENLNVENRPFYVIAMGQPKQIRYYVSNNKLGAKLTATYGTYNDSVKNLSGTTFLPVTPKDWDENKFKGAKDIAFQLTMPAYVADMGTDYVKENLIIEIDGKDRTKELKSCATVTGKNLLLGWDVSDVTKGVLTPGNHDLKVSIKKSMPSAWSNLCSEDDMGIALNPSEQAKTFALQYLLDGIRRGTEPDDVMLFTSEITFEK